MNLAKIISNLTLIKRRFFADNLKTVLIVASITSILITIIIVSGIILTRGYNYREFMEHTNNRIVYLQPKSSVSNSVFSLAPLTRFQHFNSNESINLTVSDLLEIKNDVDLIKYGWIYKTKSGMVYFLEEINEIQFFMTNADFFQTSKANVIKGNFFIDRDLENGGKIALLGVELAELLFHDQNPIGCHISTSEGTFEIVGVIKYEVNEDTESLFGNIDLTSLNKNIIIPYSSIDDVSINQICLLPDNKIDLMSFVSYIENYTQKKYDNKVVLTGSFKSYNEIKYIQKNLTVSCIFIGVIIIIISIFNIVNFKLFELQNTQKSRGLLKCIGLSNLDLYWITFLENAIFSFLSAIITIAVMPFFVNMLSEVLDMQIIIPYYIYYLGIFSVFMINFLVDGAIVYVISQDSITKLFK